MHRICSPRIVLFLPLLAAACGEADVRAYRVPKESPSNPPVLASQPSPPPAGAPVAVASGAALAWTAPASWRAVQGSTMRKATFAIGPGDGATAELAVTAFPGDVGGEVANINRWRGQIQLAPIDDAEAVAAIARVEANGLKIAVVDLAAPGSSLRMLGAMVPFGGATWFFKLLGPAGIVVEEKATFLNFVSTLRPATPVTSATATDASHP